MYKSVRIKGGLKVRVVRGTNLAIRDVISSGSDPYVVVQHAGSTMKTRVIKRDLNPVWNEDLNFSSINPLEPIKVEVFDKDTLTQDDPLGDAAVDIRFLIEAANINPGDVPEDTIVDTIMPTKINSLATDSSIYRSDGKVAQQVILKLNNVEHGELELQLEWAKL